MSGFLSKYLVDDFEYLRRYGYQVVENAVEDAEILAAELKHDIDNLKKQNNLNSDDLRLLQQYGAGNWESSWKCRIATLSVWKKLYKVNKTSDLISSWDGLTYIDSSSQVEYAKKLNQFGEPDWIHRDQSLSNENLADTIQGYLSLSDVNENEYSTVFFVPKTISAQELITRFHEMFYRKKNRYGRSINSTFTNDDDFYIFNNEELGWLRMHCDLVKPKLKKGDLLLWCSGMPHAGAPSKLCETIDPSLVVPRLGSFVAMMPKSYAHPIVLSERRSLAKTGLTSSHNVLFPKLFPYSRGHDTKHKREELKEISQEIKDFRRILIG